MSVDYDNAAAGYTLLQVLKQTSQLSNQHVSYFIVKNVTVAFVFAEIDKITPQPQQEIG